MESGEEAGRDQEFCEKFCAERGIGLKVVEADVPGIAGRDGIGLEEAGRQVRYTAFGREVREGRIDRVALAHHQNDQAETMLFHLMRGTGVRGLRGMEPVRMPYIRPFLCAAREEIVGWLTERGLSWVEDSTNREKEYTRNRIRYEVLAAMEDIRPGSTVRMAGLRSGFGRRRTIWRMSLADGWKRECGRRTERMSFLWRCSAGCTA